MILLFDNEGKYWQGHLYMKDIPPWCHNPTIYSDTVAKIKVYGSKSKDQQKKPYRIFLGMT